jgi:hypothetical protein
LHEFVSVQEGQGGEHRKQHFPYFVGTEGAPGKNLGERLIGIFHNDEQKPASAQLAATNVEESDQARMRQGGSRSPLNELRLGLQRVGRHELDGGVGDAFGPIFGKEYRAMV